MLNKARIVVAEQFEKEKSFFLSSNMFVKTIIICKLLLALLITVISGVMFLLFGLLSDVPPPAFWEESLKYLELLSFFIIAFFLVFPWRYLYRSVWFIVSFIVMVLFNCTIGLVGLTIINWLNFVTTNPWVEYFEFLRKEDQGEVLIYLIMYLSPLILFTFYSAFRNKKNLRKTLRA